MQTTITYKTYKINFFFFIQEKIAEKFFKGAAVLQLIFVNKVVFFLDKRYESLQKKRKIVVKSPLFKKF